MKIYNLVLILVLFCIIGCASQGTDSIISSGKKSNKSNKEIKKPGSTGSAEIDNFVNASFDLNDKLVSVKKKLSDVSNDLAKSNKVLEEINNHPNGAKGWASDKLPDDVSKDNLKKLQTSAKILSSDLKDLKSGLVDSGKELKSLPDDIKSIQEQAKSLLGTAGNLPNAAKSLGLKAPKALKAIKETTGLLNSIPNQISEISNENKLVMENISQNLEKINGILSNS